MRNHSIEIALQSEDQSTESLTITIGGLEAGEATVRYGRGTARVAASVDLRRFPDASDRLDQFHQEFSEELMAHVLDRGAQAQGEEGAVTYMLGTRARSLPLPTHREVGLGYPNSW